MYFLKSSLLLLIMLMAFQACKNRNIGNNDKSANYDLNNSTWYFTQISGFGKEIIALPGFKISFGTEGYSLKLDVNSCNGGFSTANNILTFKDDLSCTKKCCDGQVGESLKGVLKGDFNIEKTADKLLLKGSNYSLYLSKNEPATVLSKLPDTKWTISRIVKPGVDKKMKGYYSVTFSANAINLQLDKNSCNSASKYTADKITIDGMACTEMCCDGEEARELGFLLKGTMNYAYEENMLVIYDDKNRIWLSPLKSEEIPTEKKVDIKSLMGKTFKIYDVEFLPQGAEALAPYVINYGFDYKVTYNDGRISLNLDVNTCNGTAVYKESSIELSGMGCTKMCCDNKESEEIKSLFKGRYSFKQVGNYLIMSGGLANIRLLELK